MPGPGPGSRGGTSCAVVSGGAGAGPFPATRIEELGSGDGKAAGIEEQIPGAFRQNQGNKTIHRVQGLKTRIMSCFANTCTPVSQYHGSHKALAGGLITGQGGA